MIGMATYFLLLNRTYVFFLSKVSVKQQELLHLFVLTFTWTHIYHLSDCLVLVVILEIYVTFLLFI